MSIATELNNLEGNIEDSYDAVNDMGGIIPAQRNMDNLDQAIRTIPQNTGTTYTAGYGIDIDANNEISIDDTVVAELTDIPGVMIGATSSVPGVGGTVPAPAAGDESKVLSGAGTWVAQTAAQVNSDWNAASGVSQILNKPSLATVATSGLYSDLTGTPSLATVATSGDYGDLLNKPTIPTVNDATLTIQHNGTNVQTFTANQGTNATANVETIYADPIASSAAITPLVQTAMIADGAVTSAKIADGTIATGDIANNAVTADKIDWSTIPKYNAYYNTTYNSFPANTPIPFNTAQMNVGGFTLSNGRITIPKTGNYMITVQLWVHNNNNRSWWKLRRNGLAINEAIFEATGYWGLTAISCAYVCSQGDIIDVIKNGSESVDLNSGSADKRSTSITIQYIG